MTYVQPTGYPPQQPPKKKRTWMWIAIGLATFVVLVCVVGSLAVALSGDDDKKANPDDLALAQPSATANARPTCPVGKHPEVSKGCVDNNQPPTEAATTKPVAKPKPKAITIEVEGDLLVPAEVKPGTYSTTVPEDSFGCYWERLKGTSGDFEDILANGNGDPGQKIKVTIKKTDKAFHTDGCGVWVKIK